MQKEGSIIFTLVNDEGYKIMLLNKFKQVNGEPRHFVYLCNKVFTESAQCLAKDLTPSSPEWVKQSKRSKNKQLEIHPGMRPVNPWTCNWLNTPDNQNELYVYVNNTELAGSSNPIKNGEYFYIVQENGEIKLVREELKIEEKELGIDTNGKPRIGIEIRHNNEVLPVLKKETDNVQNLNPCHHMQESASTLVSRNITELIKAGKFENLNMDNLLGYYADKDTAINYSVIFKKKDSKGRTISADTNGTESTILN